MGARVTGSQRGGAGPGQGGAPRTQGQERRDVQGLKQVHLRPQETAGGEPPGRGGKKLDQAPASLKIAFTVSNPGRLRRGTREARKSDPSTGDSLGSAVAWVSLLGMPQHHGPRGCGVEVPEIQMTAGRAPPGLLPVVGGWPPPPHPPHTVSPLSRASVGSSRRRRGGLISCGLISSSEENWIRTTPMASLSLYFLFKKAYRQIQPHCKLLR